MQITHRACTKCSSFKSTVVKLGCTHVDAPWKLFDEPALCWQHDSRWSATVPPPTSIV